MADLNIKAELHLACSHYVEQRIQTAKQAMNDAQEAANAEEKSSAGDKYETGRAMAQIERDTAAMQLAEAMKLKRVLEQIDSQTEHHVVTLGSLVYTSLFNVYIAIGAGKTQIGNESFVIVAPEAPLGKILMAKKASDQFLFNKQTHTISRIL